MATKFLNLLAVSSLAILATSFGPSPVQALAVEGAHSGVTARGHDAIAKRRRNTKRACKQRNNTQSQPKTQQKTTAAANTNNSDQNKSSNQGSTDSSAGKTVEASSAGKFGLAWSGGDSPQLANFIPKGGKNVPLYTWNPRGPSKAKDLGFNFMPQFWGPGDKDDIQKVIKEGGFNSILAFNEPELNNDSGLSSGMDPNYAAQLYKEVLSPLKGKYKLYTPAVTSGDKGFQWMQAFMKACDGCHFDAQALHWYDVSAQNAKDHFTKHHNEFKLPIGVTEIAFNNFNGGAQLSLDQVKQQSSDLNGWFKQQDFIEFVMYFGYQDDMVNVSPTLKLKGGNGFPNDLGYEVMGQLA